MKLLLSLSGDVHFNPGPDFPCGICGDSVCDEDKAMCCDSCDLWIHVSCDVYLTEDEYGYLVQNPSYDPWLCSTCTDHCVSSSSETFSVSSSSCKLKCMYFNARSIYHKCFDLAAYVAACDSDFDIIANTESFLDSSISNSLIVPSSYIGHHLDRNRHGGGLLVMVKESLSVIHRFDLETDCELLWLELFSQPSPTLFGIFYRLPNSDVSILNSLNHSYRRLMLILVLFLQRMVVQMFLSYGVPYLSVHPLFNLLILLLRRYALSWKVLTLAKHVVQI